MTAKMKLNGYGRPATDEERVRLEKFAVDQAASMKKHLATKVDELRDFAARATAGARSQGSSVDAEKGTASLD